MRVLTHVDLAPPKRLASAVKRVLAAVEQDDFRSADMKKLGSRGGFFRAKLDYDARLLFRFGKIGGETVAFALEIIEKHAYERSRFLRGAQVDEAKLAPDGADADSHTPASLEAEPLPYVHPSRPRFHFVGKPLTFDDDQDALFRRRPPLVLVGAAGSGKTAVLLEKLRVLAGQGTVAYVTQSEWLAQSARDLYGPLSSDGDSEAAVEFLSFRAFLESVRVPTGRPVTARDFRAFFERHRSRLKGLDAHACFEELRGVLTAEPEGPLSLEAYLALGVRQSLFPVEQRSEVHALVARYRVWLDEAGLYDTNLLAYAYAGEITPRYEGLVVDEVQDFTNAELSLLLRALARPSSFVLSGDAHQIVHPNLFSWAKLRSLFFRDEALESDEIAFLSTSYRNARAVTETANALLKVKWARFGSVDRESNVLTRAAAPREGSVRGLIATPASLQELSDMIRGSARAAVIVLRDEHKAEASRVLRTPLVFSVHEAKGLEYESVVLYGFFQAEPAAYRELCAGVSKDDLPRDELAYRRAKERGDKSLEAYKFFANALYVALTRAVDHVLVVEPDGSHPLLALLDVAFDGDVKGMAKVTSSAEEWQREAHALELRGKSEQAEAIRANVLRTQPVPWTVIEGDAYRELCTKAFQKGSIFRKAKLQLLDYALVHAIGPLGERAARACEVDLNSLVPRQSALQRRTLEPYTQKNLRGVLEQCERYGLDHKNPWGFTPLMLAAWAGNEPLVRALVDRGADRAVADAFGHTAMHHVLGAAETMEPRSLSAIYECVVLDSVDLVVDGHLVRLLPHQGEFVLFALATLYFCELYGRDLGRLDGLDSAFFTSAERRADGSGGHVLSLPPSIVPEFRKARPYVSGLLARNERRSDARPNRKLWTREEHGQYVPNIELSVRYSPSAPFRPLAEVLGLGLVEEHLDPLAFGRLVTTSVTDLARAQFSRFARGRDGGGQG